MIKIINRFQNKDIVHVNVHGSKYIANRLLFICSLAEGKSILKNVPFNRDIEISITALKQLGVKITKSDNDLIIEGNLLNQQTTEDNPIKTHQEENNLPIKIYTHESGTFSRFIVPLLSLLGISLLGKRFYIYGSDRMNQRPMHDLILCLREMGVEIECEREGFLPLMLNGKNFHGGQITMKGNISSQYFSAILLVAPYIKSGVTLNISGDLISKKYVDMTIDLMNQFGVTVHRKNYSQFIVKENQKYQSKNFTIEADSVASSYFIALSFLKNQHIIIDDYNLNSVQGEAKFLHLAQELFCIDFEKKENQLFLYPKKSIEDLQGVDFGKVDMGDMPDVVQTLAVMVSAIKEAKIKITNIEHLKYKESDRISDTAKELRKFEVQVQDDSQSLTIIGGVTKKENNKIDCHNDHRMAMSLSLLSIPLGEVTVIDEECINKSFPKYWIKLKEFNLETKTL